MSSPDKSRDFIDLVKLGPVAAALRIKLELPPALDLLYLLWADDVSKAAIALLEKESWAVAGSFSCSPELDACLMLAYGYRQRAFAGLASLGRLNWVKRQAVLTQWWLREFGKGLPRPGSHWRYYKGGLCIVDGYGVQERDGQPLIHYREAATGNVWDRSLREWFELTGKEDDADRPPRFVPAVGSEAEPEFVLPASVADEAK